MEEVGPIQVSVVQLSDSPRDLVFVPHTTTREVRRLLERQGIRGNAARRILSYKMLRLAKLEPLYHITAPCAS